MQCPKNYFGLSKYSHSKEITVHAVIFTSSKRYFTHFVRIYQSLTRNNQFIQLLHQLQEKKEDSFRFRLNFELKHKRYLNLCKTFLYKVSNSCVENKEDFVFLILLENTSQTVRRMHNDTEIGHWNILRKQRQQSAYVMEETRRRVEADFSLLKMTATYPGDNTKF